MRRTGRLVLAVLLVAAGALWLAVNASIYEGPVLLTLAPGHGIVVSDLLSLIPFALAGLLLRNTLRPAANRSR